MIEAKCHKNNNSLFTSSDLLAIFSNQKYINKVFDRQSQYWLFMLALYTGATLHELYNLCFDDIVVVDSVICLKLINKNKSRRVIPLHRFIIDIGLLSYVQKRISISDNQHFLFKKQNVSSQSLNRWFNEKFLKKIGIKRKRVCFSSFRKTFMNAALAPTFMIDKTVSGEYRILVNQYVGLTNTRFASHAAFVECYHPHAFGDILSNVYFDLQLDSR